MLTLTIPVALLVVLVWLLRRLAFPATRLPPGPKGLPIIGNALQIPKQLRFLKFAEWAQELGDIFTVNVLGTPLVVLSSAQSAYLMSQQFIGCTYDGAGGDKS